MHTLYLLNTYGLMQVSKLLQFCESNDNLPSSISGVHPNQMETSSEIFEWLSILWERGFHHGNPQGIDGLLVELFY